MYLMVVLLLDSLVEWIKYMNLLLHILEVQEVGYYLFYLNTFSSRNTVSHPLLVTWAMAGDTIQVNWAC